MKLMKKLLPILCALLLCGCARKPEPPAAVPNPPPTAAPEQTPEPEKLTFPTLSDAGSLQMANHMSVDRACTDGDVLYTFDFDAAFEPVLVRFKITEKGLAERTELISGCVPEYLTLYDGRLYFVSDGAVQSVKTDGKDRKTLAENVSGDLMIADDMLWYRDADGRFCRAQLDGKNAEVVIDKLCFYPYAAGDVIIYQDDADGETLHICSPEKQLDGRLTDIPAYEYVILGDALYFTTLTENGLCPARLGADGEVEVFSNHLTDSPVRYSYFGGVWSVDGVPLDKLSSAACETGSDGYYETLELTDAGYELCARCNPDGRIREFVLYTADGEWVFIGPDSKK